MTGVHGGFSYRNRQALRTWVLQVLVGMPMLDRRPSPSRRIVSMSYTARDVLMAMTIVVIELGPGTSR